MFLDDTANHLNNSGVDAKDRYNQVANFTFLDTQVNKAVGNASPNVYFGKVIDQCESGAIAFGNISSNEALKANLTKNGIPEGVVNMAVEDYDEFLAERRVLMQKLIEKYYKKL